jgi:hypothetical protein
VRLAGANANQRVPSSSPPRIDNSPVIRHSRCEGVELLPDPFRHSDEEAPSLVGTLPDRPDYQTRDRLVFRLRRRAPSARLQDACAGPRYERGSPGT